MVEILYLKLFSPNDLDSSMYCPKKPGILVPSWNLQTLLSSFIPWIHMSSISLLATLSENTIERIMKFFTSYTDSTYKIYYTYITRLRGRHTTLFAPRWQEALVCYVAQCLSINFICRRHSMAFPVTKGRIFWYLSKENIYYNIFK